MSDSPTEPRSKPTFSYLLATALGLGYLKPAPGTWGSLAGVAVSIALAKSALSANAYFAATWLITLAISAIGVAAATRVSRYSAKKDPQFVVIDEVSGQL